MDKRTFESTKHLNQRKLARILSPCTILTVTSLNEHACWSTATLIKTKDNQSCGQAQRNIMHTRLHTNLAICFDHMAIQQQAADEGHGTRSILHIIVKHSNRAIIFNGQRYQYMYGHSYAQEWSKGSCYLYGMTHTHMDCLYMYGTAHMRTSKILINEFNYRVWHYTWLKSGAISQ